MDEVIARKQMKIGIAIAGGTIVAFLIALFLIVAANKTVDPNQATMPLKYISGQVFNMLEGDIAYVHKMHVDIDLEHKIWINSKSEVYAEMKEDWVKEYVVIKRVGDYFEVTISDVTLEEHRWTPLKHVGKYRDQWFKISKFAVIEGSLNSFFTGS